MIFDSHAHYDDECFDADRAETLSALSIDGIARVLIPAVSLQSSLDALALARKWDIIVAAAGVHPHEAAAEVEKLSSLEALLRNTDRRHLVAVGECGLDYHYDFSPRDKQKAVFDAQLSLAARYGLPVIVHVREAMEDCLDILNAHSGLRLVFHCFSGDAALAKRLASEGHMISFAGSLTFKKADTTREAAAAVPNEALLIETDAPYLAPVPLRGKRSDSRMLPHTLAALAALRGTDASAMETLTWNNGHRFFGITM